MNGERATEQSTSPLDFILHTVAVVALLGLMYRVWTQRTVEQVDWVALGIIAIAIVGTKPGAKAYLKSEVLSR